MNARTAPGDPDHRAAAGIRPFLGGGAPADPGPVPPAGPGEQTTRLRPFVITAGRVAALDPDIGVETQVTTHDGAARTRLSPEQRAILALCVEPLSVAEISARLGLHLGVTRILVGDLRAAGRLDVHVRDDDYPDPETIRRVIRGLRTL